MINKRAAANNLKKKKSQAKKDQRREATKLIERKLVKLRFSASKKKENKIGNEILHRYLTVQKIENGGKLKMGKWVVKWLRFSVRGLLDGAWLTREKPSRNNGKGTNLSFYYCQPRCCCCCCCQKAF